MPMRTTPARLGRAAAASDDPHGSREHPPVRRQRLVAMAARFQVHDFLVARVNDVGERLLEAVRPVASWVRRALR
jgi:hypothetical protein